MHARDESNSSETGMKAAGMTYGTSARQEGNGGEGVILRARRGVAPKPGRRAGAEPTMRGDREGGRGEQKGGWRKKCVLLATAVGRHSRYVPCDCQAHVKVLGSTLGGGSAWGRFVDRGRGQGSGGKGVRKSRRGAEGVPRRGRVAAPGMRKGAVQSSTHGQGNGQGGGLRELGTQYEIHWGT